MAKEDEKYGSVWLKYDTIPLGGQWAIAVGIVEDKESKERKVRISKGRVKGRVPVSLGRITVVPDDPKDPITQVNRFNIKSKEEWEEVKKLVDKYIGELKEK